MDRYFEDNVYPVLTPMAMDSSRPFPLIRNKTLNIGALISKKDKKKAGKDYWNLPLFRCLLYFQASWLILPGNKDGQYRDPSGRDHRAQYLTSFSWI